MKRKVESEPLDTTEALKFLLDGGELLTLANRIATISKQTDGQLMIYLQTQINLGKSEFIDLHKINNISLWHIKEFDFRKEMLARPDEWVGKKDIDGTEYYFGFNTVYMRVVGTSNEEAKKRKIDLGNNNHFYMRDVEGMEEI